MTMLSIICGIPVNYLETVSPLARAHSEAASAWADAICSSTSFAVLNVTSFESKEGSSISLKSLESDSKLPKSCQYSISFLSETVLKLRGAAESLGPVYQQAHGRRTFCLCEK